MRITSSNVLHQPKGLQGTPFRRYNPCTAVMSWCHRRRGVEGEAEVGGDMCEGDGRREGGRGRQKHEVGSKRLKK